MSYVLLINHSLLSGLLLTPLTLYLILTNISESSQSRIVQMAQPEKGRTKYKNVNKGKQKAKKFYKEIDNKGLYFFNPTMI